MRAWSLGSVCTTKFSYDLDCLDVVDLRTLAESERPVSFNFLNSAYTYGLRVYPARHQRCSLLDWALMSAVGVCRMLGQKRPSLRDRARRLMGGSKK